VAGAPFEVTAPAGCAPIQWKYWRYCRTSAEGAPQFGGMGLAFCDVAG
jgi:hypothetical protein